MQEPKSEAQLCEVIRDATGPLKLRGGGTRPIGNPVVGEVVSTRALSGITLYEPGALTLVAQAGTPVAEIEEALARENQRLPFEPIDHRRFMGTEGEPTIGGVVAANVSGARRIQAGACRDSLIGVRFVDGSGQAIKNGGRVMKNVTGYDLVKLMAGSYGTLGVLSEVSFKVLPGIAAEATLVIAGQSVAQAVQTMSQALSTPFDPSGLAWRDGDTLIRLEGFADAVAYRAAQMTARLGGACQLVDDPDQSRALWRSVGGLEGLADQERDLWRISVKPSDAPDVVAAIAGEVMLDWAGGLIWAQVAAGTDLRAKLADLSGHATLIRASDATKAKLGCFQPEPASIQAINKGLRAQFDPRGILNPGLMGPV